VNAAVEKAMDDLAKQRRAKAAAEAKAKHAEQTALAQRAKVLYELSRKRASQSAAARKVSSSECMCVCARSRAHHRVLGLPALVFPVLDCYALKLSCA
jgi:hypothetical protein